MTLTIYLPEWKQTQLQTGDKMCSGSSTFKHFYLRHVLVHWREKFPRLPRYNRFVELMAEVLNPLTTFMQSRCGKSNGIAFVHSTPLCVCKKSRILRHKTFADHASRQQDSFMVSSYTLLSMTVATSCPS